MKNYIHDCHCYNCNADAGLGFNDPALTSFFTCPDCGNKRCPRATDHLLDCSGSNEPNQPGSHYQHPRTP